MRSPFLIVPGLNALVGNLSGNRYNFSFPFSSCISTVRGNMALNAVAVGFSSSVAMKVLELILIFICVVARLLLVLSTPCPNPCGMAKARINMSVLTYPGSMIFISWKWVKQTSPAILVVSNLFHPVHHLAVLRFLNGDVRH